VEDLTYGKNSEKQDGERLWGGKPKDWEGFIFPADNHKLINLIIVHDNFCQFQRK
jgi:hypothetical protein